MYRETKWQDEIVDSETKELIQDGTDQQCRAWHQRRASCGTDHVLWDASTDPCQHCGKKDSHTDKHEARPIQQ